MNKFRRVTCITAALAMVVIMALAGCSAAVSPTPAASTAPSAAATTATSASAPASTSTSAPASIAGIDLSKPLALKTWLLGDKPTDSDMVYDAVNKLLTAKCNTTMDINYIPWSDATTKYQLMFASGEQFDECYTAFWTTPVYKVLATKNAFMELTPDMMQKYAPEAYANVPAAAWKEVTVNGKIYTFPTSQTAYDNKSVVMIRGDLRAKYNLPPCNTLDNLTLYLNTIAKNEKGIVPYQVEASGGFLFGVYYNQANNYSPTLTPGFFKTDITDPNQTMTCMLDDPKFLDFMNLVKTFRDNGVIPSDAASQKTSSANGQAFIAGKSAMFIWNINIIGAYNSVMSDHPEWKPEIYDPTPDTAAFPTAYQDGIAICPTSPNWQRVLIVQNLLRTNKELWDTSNYGIVGTHWEPVGDNKYKELPAGAKNFPAEGSCQWGWNTKLERIPDNFPQSYIDIEKNWESKSTNYFYLNGWALDTSNLKSTDAELQNLSTQYFNPLSLGAFTDPAATIKEWKTKAEAAGLDNYLAEAQKQSAAFAASMK